MAKETGFLKRGAKITPFMFIDILLFNASYNANKSLNQLTIEALSEHGACVSKQGIDKRFNDQAVEFVKTVFERHLANQIYNWAIQPGWLASFEHVRIKDGTRFDVPEEFSDKLPGSGGSASKAGVCIQYEFDIKSGKILDLTITPANRPDVTDAKETKGNIQKGDLSIRDLGYFIIETLSSFGKNEAYFISRLDSKTNVYEQKDGEQEELDFGAIYQFMGAQRIARLEKQAFIGKNARLPVRLIIELMPDEVYQKRMRKVNKGNKKKGYHTSESYAKRARFNLLLTNTSEDMLPAQVVAALYKIRWQVELVFKIWKSTFGIDNTRKMKYKRWLCLLYAKLLIIVINWQTIFAHRQAFYNKYNKLLSVDKCFKTLKDNMGKIRKAIKDGAEAITQIINWITNMFQQKHWLEKKKKKMGFEEIIWLTLCNTEYYDYI